MKLSVTLLLFLALQFAMTGQGIEFFEGTYQEAIVQAEKEEKLVFVDSYTTWCGPCKKMSSHTFVDETVGEYFNKNFISMKIDMEKPMGREFGSKYPVSAYPTLFFLDGKGEIVKKSTGYKDPAKLLALAKEVMGSADFSAKYAELYEAGNRDYDTVYKYVSALQQAGKPSLKIANDYISSDHQMNSEQKANFLFAAMTDADSRIFDMVMASQSEIIKLQGQAAFEEGILAAASSTTVKAIDNDYPVLIDETIEKLKEYDKSMASKYSMEANMEYAGAYDDYGSFKKLYSTYYKKYGKSDTEACKNLNKLLLDHFKLHADTPDLQLSNLENIVKLDPSEKSYLEVISFLASNKRFQEAYDICKEAKEKLEKKEVDVKQLERHLKALEQKINS